MQILILQKSIKESGAKMGKLIRKKEVKEKSNRQNGETVKHD